VFCNTHCLCFFVCVCAPQNVVNTIALKIVGWISTSTVLYVNCTVLYLVSVVLYGRYVALAHLSNDTVRFTAFLFTLAITVVSMSEFNLFKGSHFLNCFELLGNQKKPTLIFTVIVFTISCKTKTIVANVNKCTVMVTTSGSQWHCVT